MASATGTTASSIASAIVVLAAFHSSALAWSINKSKPVLSICKGLAVPTLSMEAAVAAVIASCMVPSLDVADLVGSSR